MDIQKIESKRLGECYYRLAHPSGLKVLIYPRENFNSVSAVIGTNFGSVYSRFVFNGKEVKVPDGTAHYLEHKLFESEDGDAFSKYAKTGASANAFTSFDKTCYLFSCTDKFKESLEILLDLVQTPYFTEETIAKEQGIISQEIKMYDDSPDWRVMMNLSQGMYHNNPINIDIAGSVETIAEITPEILYECYNSYYNFHNMVLAVVGKITVDEVVGILDEKLRHDEPVETKILLPEEPYEVVKNYVEQIMPVSVTQFELGFVTLKQGLCTNIMLEAFAGDCSPLYRELLDEKLINYSFGSEYSSGLGYRGVIFSGESSDPKAVCEKIRKAIVKLHETGISSEDFEVAKKLMYGKLISVYDSNFGLAVSLINSEFRNEDLMSVPELFMSLTVDDVNERLKEQLDPDNYCLSVVRGDSE